jgi:hypothetical protein
MNKLRRFKRHNTLFLIAVCALFNCNEGLFHFQAAHAAQECTLPASAVALYGQWAVDFTNSDNTTSPQRGRLQLEKNAEYPESLSGWLYWQGQKIFVAGDWQDGELSLEESLDGTSITAVWDGKADINSCGKVITGTRRMGEVTSNFVMRFSAPSW